MMDSPLIALFVYLSIGVAAGLLGSLCGVGGGILLMPVFLFLLKIDPNKAVATSLSIVLITAISSTLNNSLSSEKLIDWKIVLPIGIGAAVASWFGADLMKQLSNQTITKTFGVVLIIAGVRALIK